MNKFKKVILLFTLCLALLFIGFSLFFIAKTKLSGVYTIAIENKHELYDSISLRAKTPLGRIVSISVNSKTTYLAGLYKSLVIINNSNQEISKVSILKKDVLCYEILVPDKGIIEISEDEIPKESFKTKTIDYFKMLVSLNYLVEIVFVLILSCLLYLSYYLAKKYKNTPLEERPKMFLKVRNTLIIFIAGVVFWSIIVFIVLEISLRIIGTIHTDKISNLEHQDPKSKYTILCIGDSFTYGIGAESSKSYPNQLKELFASDSVDVETINAGICGGNTSQILEITQTYLDTYKPDLVVMLFGMANSWNYYGYSPSNNILYRLRTYKLIRRIKHNVSSKKSGLETVQLVKLFSNSILQKAINCYSLDKDMFGFFFQRGRYYLSTRDWQKALDSFVTAATIHPHNDSVIDGIWTSIENIDTDYYFSKQREVLIQNLAIDETIKMFDSLENLYPNVPDINFLKHRYYVTKSDSLAAQKIINTLCFNYPEEFKFHYIKNIYYTDQNSSNTYDSIHEKSYGDLTALAFEQISRNKISAARTNLKTAINNNPTTNTEWAKTGLFLCDLIEEKSLNTDDSVSNFNDFQTLALYLFNYLNKGLNNSDEMLSLSKFEDFTGKLNVNNQSFNEIVFKSVELYFSFKEKQHEPFSLIHANKRSMQIKDEEVFNWIRNEIEAVVHVCNKQSYPVICMNYPIIPPPNSEEISYWANNTGKIWQETAEKYNLVFINQDSIFSLYGNNKKDLFEPAFSGSEHCNVNGYALMAKNIYDAIVELELFNE
jgi:tetratricopeptide (TPR) repeat protein